MSSDYHTYSCKKQYEAEDDTENNSTYECYSNKTHRVSIGSIQMKMIDCAETIKIRFQASRCPLIGSQGRTVRILRLASWNGIGRFTICKCARCRFGLTLDLCMQHFASFEIRLIGCLQMRIVGIAFICYLLKLVHHYRQVPIVLL